MNMYVKTIATCFALTATLLLTGCGRKGDSLTMAGSTAFQTFAEKLADQYMATHPEASITVQGGGSAAGIQSAKNGAAQIGMADLVKLPPEADGLTSVVVAKDGIAVIVHPSNPVMDLTTDRIRDIFNGKVTNWKELGGQDAAITVVSRELGSGTRSSFEDIVKDVSLTKGAIIQDSNGTIAATVASDQNSIGYLSHGRLNDKVKAVTVDGIESSTDEIIAGHYKLVRPIFLLTNEEPKGAVKDFIDYMLSDAGQQTIRNNGLIPAK